MKNTTSNLHNPAKALILAIEHNIEEGDDPNNYEPVIKLRFIFEELKQCSEEMGLKSTITGDEAFGLNSNATG
tara:strand:- start:964 stop:1182 length:219 start_codon:yes stop_codon:yes gene_type:complete